MKNFLCVDTSGDTLSVVARKDGKIYSAFLPDCAMKHSVRLMEKVDEVLNAASMRLDECDFFAAVVGAGSFTGIRIGISATKGFALACKKPTLPVTSFDAIAYNNIGRKGKLLCLVDALHGYYYACGYQDGEIILPPAYISEEEVLALKAQGYALLANTNLPVAEKTDVEIFSPVEGLAFATAALCERENAFSQLEALYIRKSSAELNREQGAAK